MRVSRGLISRVPRERSIESNTQSTDAPTALDILVKIIPGTRFRSRALKDTSASSSFTEKSRGTDHPKAQTKGVRSSQRRESMLQCAPRICDRTCPIGVWLRLAAGYEVSVSKLDGCAIGGRGGELQVQVLCQSLSLSLRPAVIFAVVFSRYRERLSTFRQQQMFIRVHARSLSLIESV